MQSDFLIIVSINRSEQAQDYYKHRWQIEICFKALKLSGFDIENTHLQNIVRIEKLLRLVMIAFVWVYKAGIFRHQKIPVLIKSHGRRAKLIFKYGLDLIANTLLNAKKQNDINIFTFLSCT